MLVICYRDPWVKPSQDKTWTKIPLRRESRLRFRIEVPRWLSPLSRTVAECHIWRSSCDSRHPNLENLTQFRPQLRHPPGCWTKGRHTVDVVSKNHFFWIQWILQHMLMVCKNLCFGFFLSNKILITTLSRNISFYLFYNKIKNAPKCLTNLIFKLRKLIEENINKHTSGIHVWWWL